MSQLLLEVEGLDKRFGGLHAVKQLSLYVAKGEIVGILGRSEILLYESVLPRGAFGTRGRTDSERQRRTQDAMLFVRSLAEGFERATGRPAASLGELRAFTVARDTRSRPR